MPSCSRVVHLQYVQHKDGFMSRFYCLSETITPALAWGFLGTDTVLKNICVHFKVGNDNYV